MRITAATVTAGVAATASLSLALLSTSHTPAAADVWQSAPTTMHLITPPNLPDAVERVARDPFAVLTAGDTHPTDTGGTSSGSAVAVAPIPIASPVGPAMLSPGGVVPNPGGGGVMVASAGGVVPQDGDAQITVIGTIVGSNHQSIALVKNGTEIDYVHVGDYLGSHRVSGIYAQGIEFDDGSRLAITTASSPVQRDLSKPVPSASPSNGAGSNTALDAAQAARAAQLRANYQPLPPGALPTVDPNQSSLPMVTAAPFNPDATINPYAVASPNPQGTPHYNSTTPVPAPAPPSH